MHVQVHHHQRQQVGQRGAGRRAREQPHDPRVLAGGHAARGGAAVGVQRQGRDGVGERPHARVGVGHPQRASVLTSIIGGPVSSGRCGSTVGGARERSSISSSAARSRAAACMAQALLTAVSIDRRWARSRRWRHFADACGLELEPFQRRILRAIASGTREMVVLLPRGNGKTSLAALLALHHLVTVDGREGRGGGRQLAQQADAPVRLRRALRPRARRPARRAPPPRAALVPASRRSQKVWTRSLEVWAVGRPQAARPDLLAGDRRRAAGARPTRVYVAMASALHKRAGAQLVAISTAGQGADSPLGQLRARALALPDGPPPRRRDGRPRRRAAAAGVGDPRGRGADAARRSSGRTPRAGSRWSRSRTPRPGCPTSPSGGSSPTSGRSARATGCRRAPGRRA